MTLKQGERELNEMVSGINQSSQAGQGGRSTADTGPRGRSTFLHQTIWTQTNTLSTPVLLALLSFRAVGGHRDHLVQPSHFLDEKTKGWKN